MESQLPWATSLHSDPSFVPVSSSASALPDAGRDREGKGGRQLGVGVLAERREEAEWGLLADLLHFNVL